MGLPPPVPIRGSCPPMRLPNAFIDRFSPTKLKKPSNPSCLSSRRKFAAEANEISNSQSSVGGMPSSLASRRTLPITTLGTRNDTLHLAVLGRRNSAPLTPPRHRRRAENCMPFDIRFNSHRPQQKTSDGCPSRVERSRRLFLRSPIGKKSASESPVH